MPTITFALKDLRKLAGKDISIEQLKELVSYGKGELANYDKETVSVEFGDTNLPYLWSTAGVARLIKGVLGLHMGIPKFTTKESSYKVIVERSVEKIRPYLAAFVAKGKAIDEYLLKQLIELQEKFCENYGRRRQKVSIGIYNYKQITFPVHYRATEPDSIRFIPLEFQKEMTQAEILEEHPKGIEYAWILKGFKKYPILMDNKNDVLSFPPIINSDLSGKIEPGDRDLFIEVTGTDEDSVNLAANIFAQALFDRGFEIFSTEIKYPDRKITCPYDFDESVKINKQQVRDITGLNLTEPQIKNLLQKMQYDYQTKDNQIIVQIPFYRKDIMHSSDVIEDIAIAYGYHRIKPEPMKSYTTGATFPMQGFIDKVREIIVGLEYQEIMSAMLSNKGVLYEKMNLEDFGTRENQGFSVSQKSLISETIEIKEFMSERYSVVRTWLLPVLLECLSKNKHADYPQKIFEEGLVVLRKDENIKDVHRIALVTCHANANYTEARQAFDFLMRMLGIDYIVKETEHDSFISGRAARIYVDKKPIAYIGEFSPKVLSNWDITIPAAGFELNLSELFENI